DSLEFTYRIKRPNQLVKHHLAKWEGYQYLENGSKLTATYAFQFNKRLEFDAHNPRGISTADGPVPELDFRIFTHTLETTWKPDLKNGWQLEAGVMGMYQNNWLQGRPFIPNFAALTGGAFAVAQKRLGNWNIEAGARYDYWWMLAKRRESINIITSIHQYQSPSLTLGAIWERGKLRLQSHLGSAWRPPHVNELFSDGLHHGSATVEEGNPDLSPEQSIKWQNSISWSPNAQWQIQVSAFGQYFQNYIFAQPGGFERTIRGTFPLLVYKQARAGLAGADATLNWRSRGGLGATFKGAWLRTWNFEAREPLIFMPANWAEGEVGYFLPRDENSYLKIGYRRVAMQNQFPITPEGAGSGDWAPPPPGYGLLHLAAAWNFHLGDNHLQFGLRADNLTNERYRDYLNRFRYFADEPGRNWTIYVRLTF
ncbi:MAG: TonB-dependent receptor, partial [Bacteroidota bacterium]